MGKIKEIRALGQSIWHDNIRRSLLKSGEIRALIDRGVTGMTSNPTIFEKAIAGSADYDESLAALTRAGKSVEEIFEGLAIEDIRSAADLLRPVYERDHRRGRLHQPGSQPAPGPRHAGHGGRSAPAVQGRRAAQRDDQGAGHAGGHARHPDPDRRGHQRQRHADFLPAQYEAVMEAYLAGLETRRGGRRPVARGVGGLVFRQPRRHRGRSRSWSSAGGPSLQGKIAIANAQAGLRAASANLRGPRWQRWRPRARVQRPLWASTGTKNPAYPERCTSMP